VKKNLRSVIYSTLLTVVLLAILFYNISFQEILQAIGSVGWQFLLVGMGFHIGAYIFRTFVLWLFFRKHDVSFYLILRTHFVHNFYVHVVPASLGELSFPILLKNKIEMSKSLSILLISRILIMAITLLLFFVSVYEVFGLSDFFQFQTKYFFYLIGLAAVVGMSYFFRKQIKNLIMKLPKSQQLAEKAQKLLTQLKLNVFLLKNPLFMFSAILFTAFNILFVAGYYISILEGLHISLSLFEVLFVSSIGLAFTILPIKSIGGFGTTEGAWTIGLMLLGITKAVAIPASFALHIFALANVCIMFFIGILLQIIAKKEKIQNGRDN